MTKPPNGPPGNVLALLATQQNLPPDTRKFFKQALRLQTSLPGNLASLALKLQSAIVLADQMINHCKWHLTIAEALDINPKSQDRKHTLRVFQKCLSFIIQPQSLRQQTFVFDIARPAAALYRQGLYGEKLARQTIYHTPLAGFAKDAAAIPVPLLDHVALPENKAVSAEESNAGWEEIEIKFRASAQLIKSFSKLVRLNNRRTRNIKCRITEDGIELLIIYCAD